MYREIKDLLPEKLKGKKYYWKLYEAKVEGELSPRINETKQINWYTKK